MVPISYFLNIIICNVNKCVPLYSLVHLYHYTLFAVYIWTWYSNWMSLYCKSPYSS